MFGMCGGISLCELWAEHNDRSLTRMEGPIRKLRPASRSQRRVSPRLVQVGLLSHPYRAPRSSSMGLRMASWRAEMPEGGESAPRDFRSLPARRRCASRRFVTSPVLSTAPSSIPRTIPTIIRRAGASWRTSSVSRESCSLGCESAPREPVLIGRTPQSRRESRGDAESVEWRREIPNEG